MKRSPIPRWGRPGEAGPCRAGRLAGAVAGALLVVGAMAAPAWSQQGMIDVDTPFLGIHVAGQEPNMLREMVVRLTVLGEEYNDLARLLGVTVRSKGNLYVVAKTDDFVKRGGKEGMDSVLFVNEGRLVYRLPSASGVVWSHIQDLAFQVFADNAFSAKLPAWAGSGLGAYYGQARWTGDGFVTGMIEAGMVGPVQMDQQEGKAPLLDKLVPLSLKQWIQDPGEPERNRKAWGMVQFLMHGDGGKYRQAFAGCLQDSMKGELAMSAFGKRFGGDVKAFEARYRQWLASPQAEPNAAVATQATVATLTSFLARAYSLKLKFATAEDFFGAAKAGKIVVDGAKTPALWLPASLLDQNLQDADKLGTWSLDVKKTPPALILTETDGTIYTGSFTLAAARRPVVKVEKKGPPKAAPVPKPAGAAS